MKKNKKIILLTTGIFASNCFLLAPGLIVSCSSSKSKNNEFPPLKNDNYNENVSPFPNVQTFQKIEAKIVDRNINRNINNKTYSTQLLETYGNEGFKYPGFDHNYEQDENRFLNTSNGQKINMMNLVFEERTNFTNSRNEKATYADNEYILDQIKKKLN